jgi:GNAT superfamily N-acetyltransferase
MPGPDGNLRVLTVDLAEALHGRWRARTADVDVVRVRDVPPHAGAELRAAGFAVTSMFLTWAAALRESEEEFVARLAAKQQRSIRDSRRTADRSGTRIQAVPMTAAALEEFLAVYEDQVGRMPTGVAFARQRQGHLLADTAAHRLITARQDGVLVGGCVCRLHKDFAMIRISFAATRPDARAAGLTRAMYMAAAQHGRDLGLDWISLGSDPSLYGALTQPGLFAFKARLGFVPIPTRCFDPGDPGAVDIAQAVLTMRALTDPALLLSYATPDGPTRHWHWSDPPAWNLQVLSTRPDVDPRPYHAPFVRRSDVQVLPTVPRPLDHRAA